MVEKAPDRGDIVWVDFDHTLDREQKDKRPALVLSPKNYNAKSSLILACPLTTKIKGYPFEVKCTHKGRKSVILVDQIKSLDWRARKCSISGQVDTETLREVTDKITALLAP